MGRLKLETILQYKEIIGALSAIALWVLALWVTVKLTPFTEANLNFEYRVSALESGQQDTQGDIEEIRTNIGEIKEGIGFIKGQLTKIE